MASDTLKNSLADKLRREDPEQFQTLVRMHLSFVLDLNTDEYETSEKNKFRPSKWVFGKKTKYLTRGIMEGAPLTQEGICQAYQLIEFLSKESNICQEGIFRRTGKLTRQQELKSLLNKGVSLDLDSGNFSVHDCASVLKGFLAELPEPLLTDAHYPIYCQIAEFCGPLSSMGSTANELRLLHSLQLLLLLLPPENRILLRDVLNLLNLTASYESSNKMSAESLSTLFTPHLLCPRKLTPEAFHANSQAMSGIVAYMIHKGKVLFEIPPKLATDIRVYWAERERRSASGKKFDGNLCDGTAANTVFTFVDRERSAQENSSNPTEVALAQLYAHIQSLPESSKKRKLIKQFNKENGQGTPLQESYRRKNHHRSKSLGDSIKRHIFNKGVKRHKASNQSNCFTPLRSLSQEVLNSPLSTVPNSKMFHCSLDEESSMKDAVGPINDLPALQQSLCDSNSAVLRLRHSTRASRSSFSNRLIFPEDESSNEANTSLRKAILDNLASQVAQNRSPAHKNMTRKRSFENSEGTDKCSPVCCSVSVERERSSGSMSDIVVKEGCKAGEEEFRDTPVSSGSVLSDGCKRQSTDSANALLRLSPCLTSTTNKLTTPHKHRTSNDCLVTSTPAFSRISSNVGPYDIKQTSLNHSNCFLTPIADENNSMSPITRSTQRMSKAMQETMMTPRSRKPVVVLSGSNICHLGNVASWRKQTANLWENHCKEKVVEPTKMNHSSGASHTKTSREDCTSGEPSASNSVEDITNNEISHSNCCGSGDSLTSTFKSYLMSRSVLTASPVDLSFSSRTGDFDTSSGERCLSTDALSDSLLYCLDGNDPQQSSESLNNGDNCHSHCVKECESDQDTCRTHESVHEELCFSSTEMHPDILKIKSNHRTPVHETSL